jgi:MarR family transcriptional regulator, organic hydroperoxide resistance regulator
MGAAPDRAEPDQRIYLLIQRVAHRLRIWADRRCLDAAGITTAQAGVLFVLVDRPKTTQRELAAELGLRESAVTAMTRRLLDAGLVERHASPTDHRAFPLSLTRRGERAIDAVRPVLDDFNAALRRTLGVEGRSGLAAALRTLLTAGEPEPLP